MHAAFAADAGLLRTTKWRAQIAQKPRVDPHDAGIDGRAQTKASPDIAGPHRRREAVRRVVRQPHRLLLAVERAQVTARAEDFLANHRRGLRQSGPNGRLDPRAAGQRLRHRRYPSSAHEVCTVGDGLTVIMQHLFTMLQTDERPDASALVRGVTWLEQFRLLLQGHNELVEYRALHVD